MADCRVWSRSHTFCGSCRRDESSERDSRRPSRLFLVSQHATPETLHTPEPRAKTLELHDLAVVHEQIHFGAIVLDVPAEHLRISRLEHHRVQPQLTSEP